MPPRSGRYGCARRRSGAPKAARRRSIRATSRDPSIPAAMSSTPIPARSVAIPAEASETITLKAKIPMKKPRPIAAFAYQVAGWIGESRNARTGWRASRARPSGPAPRSSSASGPRSIPDEANVAPPGIQADASPARISSSPAIRTAAPITIRWAPAAPR